MTATALIGPPSRVGNQSALEIVRAATRWTQKYGPVLEGLSGNQLQSMLRFHPPADQRGIIDEFWGTLTPLFAELVSNHIGCAWCTAGIQVGLHAPGTAAALPVDEPGFKFSSEGRPDVLRDAGWKLPPIIQMLSGRCREAPFEILLTTDLCVNTLRDGAPLVIRRAANIGTVDLPAFARFVTVDGMASEIAARSDIFRDPINALMTAPEVDACREPLAQIDSLLQELLERSELVQHVTFDGPENDELHDVLRQEVLRGSRPGLALAKYLLFMTMLWPRWTRISMVPYVGPAHHSAEPGGLVICEDKVMPLELLNTEEITTAGQLASVAMWPWLALRSSVDANMTGTQQLINILRPNTDLRVIRNELASREARFGGGLVSLIDTKRAGTTPLCDEMSYRRYEIERDTLFDFLYDTASAPPGITILMPMRGRKRVVMEAIASIGRQTYVMTRPDRVELILVQGGNVRNPDQDPVDDDLIERLCKLPKEMHENVHVIRLTRNDDKFQKVGRSTTRNVGLSMASEDNFLVLVDSSMILANDFIADHALRHQRLPNIALLGFKQNITEVDYFGRQRDIELGTWRPDFTHDWKFHHELKAGEGGFTVRARQYPDGTTVNYMDMTNWLRGVSATMALGPRSLPTFFQTNIVSVAVRHVRGVGGFDAQFDAKWGLEDTFLGALLLCRDVRLVPCPSSVAFKIDKADHAEKPFELERSRALFEEKISLPSSSFIERRFQQQLADAQRRLTIERWHLDGKVEPLFKPLAH